MKKKALVSWSGGKDSYLALAELMRSREYEVAALLTTMTSEPEGVTIHGVRPALVQQQADALGLPLHLVYIPQGASNQLYEATHKEVFARYREQGVDTVVFGDLFLTEIRNYREALMNKAHMHALFPLWQRETAALARDFLASGCRATVVSVNAERLDRSFVGCVFDEDLLARLPDAVDPCGENGEFHTFVFEAPLFEQPIRVIPGTISLREGHYLCDLLPAC